MFAKYRQTTYETCLACSLLLSAGKKVTREEELKIINYSLKFSRDSFALGHLDYFSRKYGRKINFYIESKGLANSWKGINRSRGIIIKNEKVTSRLISSLVKISPLIIYIDSFVLHKEVHYPHYLVVLNQKNNKYIVSDPWDGKIKKVNKKILLKGVDMLRNHLLFSPQLIQVIQ